MSTNSLPGLDAVQLLEVDPAILAVDMQVRSDATPDEAMIASVKSFGVQQPPTVYWDTVREKHVIVMGHRRVGAAIAAGLSSIHVLVRDASEAQDAARVERQLVENERREALTPADTARGYKELQLFGRTPEDIAASVGEKPERVRAALKAVHSAKASEAMEQGIDLEQAAIIAEFDDDEETQHRLTTTAIQDPSDFNRRVLIARGARERDARVAAFTKELDAEGTKLLASVGYAAHYYNGDGQNVPWNRPRTLDALNIAPADHSTCPGHAAIIENTGSEEYAGIAYICSDWREFGHEGAGEASAPELTPEQIERQQELARRQEEREQARLLIDANTTARRDWLRSFILGRLNQTAGIFDLVADVTLHPNLQEGNSDHIGIYLLTGEKRGPSWEGGLLRETVERGTATALRAIVVDAIARAEHTIEGDDVGSAPETIEAYLSRLEGWGYQLTDLDKEVRAAASEATARNASEAADDDADDEGGE